VKVGLAAGNLMMESKWGWKARNVINRLTNNWATPVGSGRIICVGSTPAGLTYRTVTIAQLVERSMELVTMFLVFACWVFPVKIIQQVRYNVVVAGSTTTFFLSP
jgi:hypothetical protein